MDVNDRIEKAVKTYSVRTKSFIGKKEEKKENKNGRLKHNLYTNFDI